MLSRFKVPLALAVVVAAIGWLVASGVAKNDMYVSTLAQWDPGRARRESVRVMGFVKEGSVSERSGELVTDFVIRDETGGRSLPVRYHGVLPDMFREGSNVIAGGRLGEDGIFVANDVMTKCPSKYEGAESPHPNPGSAPMPAAATVPAASAGPVPAASADARAPTPT